MISPVYPGTPACPVVNAVRGCGALGVAEDDTLTTLGGVVGMLTVAFSFSLNNTSRYWGISKWWWVSTLHHLYHHPESTGDRKESINACAGLNGRWVSHATLYIQERSGEIEVHGIWRHIKKLPDLLAQAVNTHRTPNNRSHGAAILKHNQYQK
jgi:hypothetical protein